MPIQRIPKRAEHHDHSPTFARQHLKLRSIRLELLIAPDEQEEFDELASIASSIETRARARVLRKHCEESGEGKYLTSSRVMLGTIGGQDTSVAYHLRCREDVSQGEDHNPLLRWRVVQCLHAN